MFLVTEWQGRKKESRGKRGEGEKNLPSKKRTDRRSLWIRRKRGGGEVQVRRREGKEGPNIFGDPSSVPKVQHASRGKTGGEGGVFPNFYFDIPPREGR